MEGRNLHINIDHNTSSNITTSSNEEISEGAFNFLLFPFHSAEGKKSLALIIWQVEYVIKCVFKYWPIWNLAHRNEENKDG